VVLFEGRIVEQGPPEQLLGAGGPFARLFAEEAIEVG
jgi:ABC-type multidrug transport system fused ATPase/permease subunit